MPDDPRDRDPVHVRVIGRQFRHDGEEYLHGDELEVEEWLLDSYSGRIERVADVDEPNPEPDDADEEDVVLDDGAVEAADGEPVVDSHPSELTNAEVEERVADVDDVELLQTIRDLEVGGKDRKGAKAAIDARLDEMGG